jgi:hypothetical protein
MLLSLKKNYIVFKGSFSGDLTKVKRSISIKRFLKGCVGRVILNFYSGAIVHSEGVDGVCTKENAWREHA